MSDEFAKFINEQDKEKNHDFFGLKCVRAVEEKGSALLWAFPSSLCFDRTPPFQLISRVVCNRGFGCGGRHYHNTKAGLGDGKGTPMWLCVRCREGIADFDAH